MTTYRSPLALIQTLRRLAPNQWLTLQSYVFVTGDRKGHWRCNARHWQDHWTNDAERYCWNDYRRILNAIPSRRARYRSQDGRPRLGPDQLPAAGALTRGLERRFDGPRHGGLGGSVPRAPSGVNRRSCGIRPGAPGAASA